MNVGDMIDIARAAFRQAEIASGDRDARWIIADVLGRDPGTVHLFPEITISETEAATIQECIRSRSLGQPVAQIIGAREFWGRRFRVTSDTLDPRPETELIIANTQMAPPPRRIIDLGTGTGCILISLLCDYPQATGIGTDLSERALDVARENAAVHGVANRAEFLCADWWDGVTGRFDLIISNPPYIAASEMSGLDRDVRDWEPHMALTPGGDGLAAYRRIAEQIDAFRTPDATAIFEIGHQQAGDVLDIFAAVPGARAYVTQDLNGHDRNVIVHFSDAAT